MIWRQGAQNYIGLAALKCTVRSQCTPVPDGRTDAQTDEHHDNSATIRLNERIPRKKQKQQDCQNSLKSARLMGVSVYGGIYFGKDTF